MTPTMTPRQRWLALLERKPVDRIPTDYTATPEVTARLLSELGCADERALWEKLHIDGRIDLAPAWKLPHHPDDPLADMWGVRYQSVDYGTGTYEEPGFHPLAAATCVEDIHRHRWPDPDDFDYSVVTAGVEASDGIYPIHGGWFEPFLFYAYLRGLEQAFEDLILEPEIADAVLGHIFDFSHEYHRRLWEAGQGKIDTTWIAEDLARIEGALDDVLTTTATAPEAIDKVFLTGGTSFVPAVRRIFTDRFDASRIETGGEMVSIAHGLALIGERDDIAQWVA